jgi:ribonucleoside-diphosphate reductase alpha chain
VAGVTECLSIFGATEGWNPNVGKGETMPATEETATVPELDDFDFPLTDGAACRIDDPDCEACQ